MNRIIFYITLLLGSVGIVVMYWMQSKSTSTYYSLEAALEERPFFVKHLTLNRHRKCMKQLPKELARFTNLEQLSLSELYLTALDSNLLKQWANLKELSIYDNFVQEIPSAIRYCKDLERLNCAQNYVTALPDELFQLTHLKSIDADFNNIRELPTTFILPYLEKLSLSNNYLTTYPSRLCESPKLTSLTLNDNDIRTIPDTVSCPPWLEYLSLEDNPISALPDDFFLSNQKTLRSLYLDDTNLEMLPSSLQEMTALEDLNISGTKIKTLPDWIGKLTNLTYLSIENTEITDFPESMKNLTAIEDIQTGRDMPEEVRAKLEALFPNARFNYGFY